MVVKSYFVIPELGLRIRHVRPNEEQKQKASNSGGYWLSFPLAFRIQPRPNYSFRLFGEIPVIQRLEGLQITTDYKIGLEIRYQFLVSKKNKETAPFELLN